MNHQQDADIAVTVPDGWYVMNPRRVAELKDAERAVLRARELADEWASEPYAEEFTSVLAGVLIDALNGADQ